MPASAVFYRQYVISAMWSDQPYLGGDNDDRSFQDCGYTIENLATATAQAMRADCDKFCDDPVLVADIAAWRRSFDEDTMAAHDFYLTRNGHGAGFWSRFHGDNPLVEVGTRLAAAAEAYGAYTLYLGDDGLVHGGPG